MIGFVDESVDERPVGTYVLGCVVTPDVECDGFRAELGGHRFHFYTATERRRVGMLTKIGSWKVLTCAYVYRGIFPLGQEGARELCLRRLLLDLHKWDCVDELVIEQRQPGSDTQDAITIVSALDGKAAPARLKYHWEPADSDPLLWTADCIAGAVRISKAFGDRYDAYLTRTTIRSLT